MNEVKPRAAYRPSAFKMRDISKTLRAARAAGVVKAFTVDKNGQITVQMGTATDIAAEAKGANEWDEVLKEGQPD